MSETCSTGQITCLRFAQVLLDDEPGLLGSIVDVRITASTRWSTFAEVVFWVYRCPPPPAAAEPVSASALRARARVIAGRDRVANPDADAERGERVSTTRACYDSDEQISPRLRSKNGAESVNTSDSASGHSGDADADSVPASDTSARTLGVPGEVRADSPESDSASAWCNGSVAALWQLSMHRAATIRARAQALDVPERILCVGVAVGIAGLAGAAALRLQRTQCD